MTKELSGIYSLFLTGKAGQGFGLLLLRKGKIIGAGAGGGLFDGSYVMVPGNKINVTVVSKLPPNTAITQGGVSGPQGSED
jgi:hypothetical protein